jgi:hypothetical protein
MTAERDISRSRGMENYARSLAESIFRDLSLSMDDAPESERWKEAKRRAAKRLSIRP